MQRYVLVLLGVLFLIAIGFFILNNKLRSGGQMTTRLDTSRDAVIKEMQELNRIETSSFTLEKVIEAEKSGNAFQNLLYGDRILLIAHGKVIAGIDMSQLKEKDVNVNGDTLNITLPSPVILTTTLDNNKTQVYDRKLGLLSKGDKDLESQARSQAVDTITKAACDANILTEAGTNAKNVLEKMFSLTGYKVINITVPIGSC